MSGPGASLRATVKVFKEMNFEATSARMLESRPSESGMQSAKFLFTAPSVKDRNFMHISSIAEEAADLTLPLYIS